ncbi:Cell fate regulator YaaT, PSP1 superfamily (controls sporulation, competence, biofilm development) [Dethiosulfatibacter aminovorans DSM 17477]|uniref:Cell fate regulator YaaT, PSP1 superfamily (Controls sporulation, competence, biofilm development) n=1 Tax=Dethiosulfatibacter aminovorans DSM 17477 TaxID=1121476 RepID=A0A1M6CF85_9FIRM|nr:Cell fate regulator YaaT, PSP1 superfamily (controls sporulation, competence, biofilm development) [Dethiosulfatibacter aminovorans DSM 17477]
MISVVGVRFKKAGKIYYFDPDSKLVKKDDDVIVETARGIEFGSAVVGPKLISEEEVIQPLKKVLRVATKDDIEKNARNKRNEQKAFVTCMEKIEEHKLEMKLVDVEYTFDNNKVIFYFTAEGRVDFRELVKDLASIFKTRIELRQIGVRDEAKMIGGLGPCGRPLCCSSFLGDFAPVSIKMAKEQSLSLNPTKISGICSRLMCCLNYEKDLYEENLDRLPKIGDRVETPNGIGDVIRINPLLSKVKVRIKRSSDRGDIDEIEDFEEEDVKKLKKGDKGYDRSEPSPKNTGKPDRQNKDGKKEGQGRKDQDRKDRYRKGKQSKNKVEVKEGQENKDVSEKQDQPQKQDDRGKQPKQQKRPRQPKQQNKQEQQSQDKKEGLEKKERPERKGRSNKKSRYRKDRNDNRDRQEKKEKPENSEKQQ